MKPSRSMEDAAFRSVKRACYAGLDSVSLRLEVTRRIGALVPHAAYSFNTADPDTGLSVHSVAEGIPEKIGRIYMEELYPEEEAARTLDRVRAGDTVSRETSPLLTELLRGAGLDHEINTVMAADGGLYGDLCLLRERVARGFEDDELRFMRRIAPHVARGLKAAATLAAARASEAGAAGVDPGTAHAPGVVVLDHRARMLLHNTAAARQMQDLADIGWIPDAVPHAVVAVAALVRFRHRTADPAADDQSGDSGIRVRGHSGAWYTLRASLAEPGPDGRGSTIVTIEPIARREIAPLLARLYGLSPREREIAALTARGESTKCIAARLGLSPYTVQEHLGNACAKVGVRGRRALLAKLFFDGYGRETGE